MSDRPRPEPAPRDWIDRFILPFVREPTLWPVLIVLIAHAVAFLGPAMLFAVRDQGRGSIAVLALLAALYPSTALNPPKRSAAHPMAAPPIRNSRIASTAHQTHIF